MAPAQPTEPDSRYRVLFVDDDPSVLSAFRRMLRPQGHRWHMSFADGGASALEVLLQQPFEVMVSDMRMPGMDGATLLREVQRLYPHTYRVVLSGYVEPDAISSVMQVAQRFLAKPCAPAELVEAIEQGCLPER